MAGRFRLAGSNIRNILVGAAHLAARDRQVATMGHLHSGTRRKLQKMGRLMGDGQMMAVGRDAH
jgi:hypothetical protein